MVISRTIYQFLRDHKNDVFRYLTYKRVFTPYEQEEKFIDESVYEDGGRYSFGKITNCIECLNGGYLLEFTPVDTDALYNGEIVELNHKEYRMLSEIQLSLWDIDNDSSAIDEICV